MQIFKSAEVENWMISCQTQMTEFTLWLTLTKHS